MSKLPPRRQTSANPFIAPDSKYRCAVRDCTAHGVWSPMVNGSVWYCRQHAELPEPEPRWEPKPPPYTAEEIAMAKHKLKAFIARTEAALEMLAPASDDWWHKLIMRWRNGEKLLLIQQDMSRQAWINAGRPDEWTPPDIEDAEERRAIQSEGNP